MHSADDRSMHPLWSHLLASIGFTPDRENVHQQLQLVHIHPGTALNVTQLRVCPDFFMLTQCFMNVHVDLEYS